MVKVRGSFQIDSDLLCKSGIVRIEKLNLDKINVTFCPRCSRPSRMLLALLDFRLSPCHCELPSKPCHLKVHPPFCMPISSKFLKSSFLANPLILMTLSPTKTMYLRFAGLRGITLLSFFSKTKDS